MCITFDLFCAQYKADKKNSREILIQIGWAFWGEWLLSSFCANNGIKGVISGN